MTASLIFAILQPVALLVLLVWLARIRSTLATMQLDPDTVDAACHRVALRGFRKILWGVGALMFLQLGWLGFLLQTRVGSAG